MAYPDRGLVVEAFNLLTYKSNKMIKNTTTAFTRDYESPDAKVLTLTGQAELLASSGPYGLNGFAGTDDIYNVYDEDF